MNSAQQLAERFKALFLNGTWIANTNYQMLLSDVSYKQATEKFGDLNTIAVLTFHVNYYVEGVLQVLLGGDLTIRDKYSFDAPTLNSEEEWNAVKTNFYNNCEAFAQQIELMSENQLEAVFVDEKYGDFRRNIEGLIEHGYYHLGQISLIKKLTQNTN